MISRRTFNAALTGLVAGASVPPTLVLKAQFAAHLPSTLTITGVDVAHALLRAASPLLATPGQVAAGVETSLDTARTSACATIIFEVRSYRTNSARLGSSLEEIFPSAGIHPLLREKLTFLIPFENLSAREQAWNILNADSRWHEVRREVQSYQFGLYRLAA